MPPPDTVKIPMLQHIGAPAEPVVNTGDRVFVGTLIGKAAGAVSSRGAFKRFGHRKGGGKRNFGW